MHRRAFFCAVAATLLPSAALTQPAVRMYRIGFLGAASASAPISKRRIEALRRGLRELGYIEGTNISIDLRWADGDANRLGELARDLVRLEVDVLVTQGTTATRAAKSATSTIPIVMLAAGDAIGAGLVTDLARPGGNVTGSSFFGPQLYAKEVEILKEAMPRATRVAVLSNPDNPINQEVIRVMKTSARAMAVTLSGFDARGVADLERVFAGMAQQQVDAMVVIADPILTANSRAIADMAIRQRLPTASGVDFAESGGLIGYGPSINELWGRASRFVDRILKGARPGDLPVEQPTKFELVINLNTAKKIGLAIPQSLTLRADDVIQ